MQKLSLRRRRGRELPLSETAVGCLALGVIAVLLAVAAYFYLAPPGQRTVTFSVRDAVSLRGGEDVRVAGVSVGSVKGLELKDNEVVVTAEIDSAVRLGDRTRVDVRLLTAVGGYFVTLIPDGRPVDSPITIPVSRVTVPYTIADTLQELPRITDETTGTPVDSILDQITSGLTDNPDAIANVVSGLRSLTTVMARQKHEVQSTLTMAAEYSSTFDASRDYLFVLLRKVNTVLSEYYTYRHQFSEAIAQLGNVLIRLGAVAQFYVNHEENIGALITSMRDAAEKARAGLDTLIGGLEPLGERLVDLARTAAPTSTEDRSRAAGNEFERGEICLPIAGRRC